MSEPVTLCMIVKNEAAIIEKCLHSVRPFIDRWSVLDTGSSDGTQDVVRAALSNVQGQLYESSWKQFDGSRNQALDLARADCDGKGWLLLIDADEQLQVSKQPALEGPFDCHETWVTRCDECSRWTRPTFVRASKRWYFEMPRHEGLYCRDDARTAPHALEGALIMSGSDGARAQEGAYERYLNDARILEEWLPRHPGHTRCMYYLAQSYRDAATGLAPLDQDLMRVASAKYLERAKIVGFDQEQFSAVYQAALCLSDSGGAWPDVQDLLLRSFTLRPSRAEPIFRLGRYYREQGALELSELFARPASLLPMSLDVLDVDQSVYEWRAKDSLAQTLALKNKKDEAFRLWQRLLQLQRIPAEDRRRMESAING